MHASNRWIWIAAALLSAPVMASVPGSLEALDLDEQLPTPGDVINVEVIEITEPSIFTAAPRPNRPLPWLIQAGWWMGLSYALLVGVSVVRKSMRRVETVPEETFADELPSMVDAVR